MTTKFYKPARDGLMIPLEGGGFLPSEGGRLDPMNSYVARLIREGDVIEIADDVAGKTAQKGDLK